jgi:shikimate kinase
MNNQIFLIGMMGAGKSSIGKILSTSLNMRFCDTDDIIKKDTGVDINRIFELEGETGFRNWERKAFLSIVDKKNIVVATGGGIILNDDNFEILKKKKFVFFLKTDLDNLLVRLSKDGSRPLIKVSDVKKQINDLYTRRKKKYEEAANYTIETTKSNSLVEVSNRISSIFIKYNNEKN